MSAPVTIHCCGCGKVVAPRLTNGKEIYPHREDLHELPFWKCDTCGNFVGCHHKSRERTKPLGSIPTPGIRNARKVIHAVLDPMWKSGSFTRSGLYHRLSKVIGRQYHTAEVNTFEEANLILQTLQSMKELA